MYDQGTHIHALAPCFKSIYLLLRLFRALAGLDDPADEAPSVIVSRYSGQRPTPNVDASGANVRNNNGGGDDSGRLTFAFGRASSVVGSSSRRPHSAVHDDGGSDMDVDNGSSGDDDVPAVWGGGGGGGGSKRRGLGVSSARFSIDSASGVNAFSSSRKKLSSRFVSGFNGTGDGGVPLSSGGTWLAFSRECARQDDGRSSRERSRERSRYQNRRTSHGATAVDDSGGGSTVRDAVAPGFEGGRGASAGAGIASADSSHDGGMPSPGSSTVSGLTGWRRQRLQQRNISKLSSQRAAREAGAALALNDSGRDRCRATTQGVGELAEESKHGHDDGEGAQPSHPQGGRTSATVKASSRSWNKERAGADRDGQASTTETSRSKAGGRGGVAEEGQRDTTGAGTNVSTRKTGIKGLSSLSRPSPGEADTVTTTANRIGPRSAAAVTKADGTGSSPSNPFVGSGGGEVESSRSGMKMSDVLKVHHARGASGSGSGSRGDGSRGGTGGRRGDGGGGRQR